MKLKCLIVDDESIAQEIIVKYVALLDQLEVVGRCFNALEANNALNSQNVDLIFLDIEMPHLSGLAFLKNLVNPPKVIITTAYREHALEGFELDVIDYLLKPISQERFLKAVNKVISRPESSVSEHPYIYLKVDMKMVKVVLDEIRYIESLSNYVKIFTKEKTLISYQKLAYLEEVLPTNKFVRSHRSFIVNIDQITAFTFTSTDVEIDNTELPIGGKYRVDLNDRLLHKKL